MPRAALAVGLLLASACENASSAPTATPSRVVAVAPKSQSHGLEHLCDVMPPTGRAPQLRWPELEGAPPTATGFRWINVWASWCKPCIEELPLIEKALADMQRSGAAMTFVALSADQSADDVATFVERFPVLEGTRRFADESTVPSWAAEMGLDEGATLPLHVFVDGAGNVRCARAGAVSPADIALVPQLLE